MIKFDSLYFDKLEFTNAQIQKYLENSKRDLTIAKKVDILDVKFTYAYSSFLKAGIALLASHGMKVRSVPGHQVKIIQKMSQLLGIPEMEEMGNLMRAKRNADFYGGGIEVTETECRRYIRFVEAVVDEIHKAVEGP